MENGKAINGSGAIDIKHVMKLAKLDLSDSDSLHFSGEINKILDYIDMLKGADMSSLDGITGELEYDKLVSRTLDTNFYKDCRQDVCEKDLSFDFRDVESNAPGFDTDEEGGFFVVPQVIE